MLTRELVSTIHDVVVYREGAVVTRLAALEAGAWPDELVLAGLPLALDDGSVRARVEVDGDAVAPMPSDVQVELQAPPLGETVEPPSEAALREAREEVSRLDWLLRRVDDEVGLLEKVTFKLPERIEREPPRPLHDAVLRGTASWIERARRQRVERKASLRGQLRAAEERRDRLERQAMQARAERGVDEARVCKRVRVRLEGSGQGPASRLLVEYRVPGARWRPSYVLRVARDGTRAELGVRALVCQASGEPWARVRLAVSTADLRREVELPELRSLRIGRQQPEPPRRAWRDPPSGAFALFEGLDRFVQSTPRPSPGGFSEEEVTSPGLGGEPTPQASVVDMPEPTYADVDAQAYPEEEPAELDEDVEFEGAAAMDKMEAAEAELAQTPAAPVMVAEALAPPAPTARPAPMRSAAPAGIAMARGAPMAKKQAAGRRSVVASEDLAFRAVASGGGADDDDADVVTRDVMTMELQTQTTLVQYSELRLVGWQDAQHTRGALRRLGLRDVLEGLSPTAVRQVERVLNAARGRAQRLEGFAAGTQPVDLSAGAFDYRYDAVAAVDVPADGKVHSVPLLSASAHVDLTLVVVPRESDQAVRVASLENPLQAPLLAGPAEIYLEDEFLVDSRLDTVPRGGRLDVGLGVEEALKVARNSRYKESAQGLLRGGLALEHSIEIELGSRLTSAVRVEVRERIPHVPKESKEQIVVQEGAVEPPWEKWDQGSEHRLEAGRRWKLSLKPGESRTLKAAYAVHLDAKDELVGGNRRERGAR